MVQLWQAFVSLESSADLAPWLHELKRTHVQAPPCLWPVFERQQLLKAVGGYAHKLSMQACTPLDLFIRNVLVPSAAAHPGAISTSLEALSGLAWTWALFTSQSIRIGADHCLVPLHHTTQQLHAGKQASSVQTPNLPWIGTQIAAARNVVKQNVKWHLDGNKLCLSTLSSLSKGTVLRSHHGFTEISSNEMLLATYGFVLNENLHNHLRVDPEALLEGASADFKGNSTLVQIETSYKRRHLENLWRLQPQMGSGHGVHMSLTPHSHGAAMLSVLSIILAPTLVELRALAKRKYTPMNDTLTENMAKLVETTLQLQSKFDNSSTLASDAEARGAAMNASLVKKILYPQEWPSWGKEQYNPFGGSGHGTSPLTERMKRQCLDRLGMLRQLRLERHALLRDIISQLRHYQSGAGLPPKVCEASMGPGGLDGGPTRSRRQDELRTSGVHEYQDHQDEHST